MHIKVMKLATYLADKKIPDARFAARLGKERSVITKYRTGIVCPPLDVIARIRLETNGLVSYEDFLSDEWLNPRSARENA
jgi:hypothetical protein